MANHRFGVGEDDLEKRFPDRVRRTQMVVVHLLAGAEEPSYRLRDAHGGSHCVLVDRSELSPPAPTQKAGWHLEPSGCDKAGSHPSPWSA